MVLDLRAVKSKKRVAVQSPQGREIMGRRHR